MLISPSTSEKLGKSIQEKDIVYCKGLCLSARWFVFSQVVKDGLHLIIMPTKESAEYCCADLYNLIDGDNIFLLPESGRSIEKSNYRSTLEVQRTSAIKVISEKDKQLKVIVSYPEALEENIPSRKNINASFFTLSKGEEISHEQLSEKLYGSGFEKVDFVSLPGQYAIRGSIVDVFSFSNNFPYRISFWGNEIERISTFECNTQLTKEEKESVDIVSDILSNPDKSGVSVISTLPSKTVIWFDSSDIYKDKSFYKETGKYKRVYLDIPVGLSQEIELLEFKISPQPVFNKNFELLSEDIKTKMESSWNVCIFSEKDSQTERLKSVLSQNCSILPEFIQGKNIHNGFIDSESRTCCYSDHEIFDRFHRVSIRKSVDKSEQLTLNDLNAFNIGDYVVHIDYGIGIFSGLVRMRDADGKMRETVKISYRDGDAVYVSIHALHKISRFRSKNDEPPKINKLGSKTWIALKNSAKSKVKDIAKDLIRLYAKRRASDGFAFSADNYLQEELESSFLYEDTPDQEAATKAIKKDMEEKCPMDRLVCGDVGFGKTELAIRAAFKAVADNKQVAVLVPTTILALQHYKTFSSRLKDFPCNIDYVSRLRTAKQTTDIKNRLKSGQIDILIGTHKILSSQFEFKDLGLLIIDEEQKFGVSAKEKLRQIKASVDTLTLTATPIPRTLQFSLLGARDLSIINTAPPNRIPVQTEIILFEEKEIKDAINYEVRRGGQVFFLHNNVEELPSVYDILHRLVPDVKICMAHGQMESGALENIMLDFINGDYDLILCTSIIENGLDIPNANTIIINQAQNFGLSELHQLRGRVGRSNKKAFCYLIVPPLVSISEDSRRRLKAIEEFSDLGSGFNIAMQDLDIRGAGNLLGAEQSGFIMEMGFETYQKILSEAIEELGFETGFETIQSSQEKLLVDCTVETDLPALIPDEYINVGAEKLRIYRQMDAISSEKEIDKFGVRLADRFGKLPQETENLLMVVKLRNLGSAMGFEKVIVKNGLLIAFFVSNALSNYYKSDKFANILQNLNNHPEIALKQTESKLKIVTRGINTLEAAFNKLKQIQ